MRQVVYDTQTLVRALVDPREPYASLFFLPADWKLCVSDVILREAVEVMFGGSGLTGILPGLTEIPVTEVYRQLGEGGVFPVPSDIEIEICRDPNDNKFLASALAMDCDVLVTEIPDLVELEKNPEWLEFKQTNAVRVVISDPRSFVGMVGGS